MTDSPPQHYGVNDRGRDEEMEGKPPGICDIVIDVGGVAFERRPSIIEVGSYSDKLKRLDAMGRQTRTSKWFVTPSAGQALYPGYDIEQLGKNVSYQSMEKRMSTACSALSLLALLVALLEFATHNELFSIALSVTTCIHVFCTVVLYRNKHLRLAIWAPVWQRQDRGFRQRLAQFLLETLVILVHKIPFTLTPRIVNLAVFLRLLTLMRTLRDVSFASSASSILVGALCNIKMDALFVYKTRLFSSPILTMSITSGAGLVLLSFITWFVESNYGELTLAQSFWFTFVTATTVGYGDYTPASVWGKLVGMVSALYGIIVTAILVSVVQHKLTMTGIQKQIILFLAEVRRVQRTKQKAARVVGLTMIYYKLLRVVESSNMPVPPHRFYTSSTSSYEHQVLMATWINLQEAIQDVRELRRSSSTAWASISVLDVLHADSSDILAQNTVLQYLMHPADEDLSTMLRVGKHKPHINTRHRRVSESTSLARERDLDPIEFSRDNLPSGGLLSPTPMPPLPPPPPDFDPKPALSDGGSSDGVASGGARSRGSITSLMSSRTAQSTTMMVDLLKSVVTPGGGSVHKKMQKKKKNALEVEVSYDDDGSSVYSASPRGRSLLSASAMPRCAASQGSVDKLHDTARRVESLLVHMITEMNLPIPEQQECTLPPSRSVHTPTKSL